MPLEQASTKNIFRSVCPHDCPSTCALVVDKIEPNKIGRVHGAEDQDYTAGVICAKVARYAERHHHPDRLNTPLLRVGPKGQGKSAYKSITWDEALDRTADAFAEAAAKHGPQTVWPYFYAGTMGLVQRDGINRLRHVMGYAGFDGSICTRLADAGWQAAVGAKRGVDAREMAEADVIISWGGNPVATQVNVMTHVSRARKARGAKFVVVDPYRTATAEVADLHICLQPGTDAALACGVMHVLFKEGFADRDYLTRFADDAAGLEAHLKDRDPAWAASITGVGADQIIDLARIIGANKRCFFRLGYGFSRARNGSVSMHAVACIPTVTGAWAERGGGALYAQSAPIYHLDKTLIEGLDAVKPGIRILDQSRTGPVLTGDPIDLGDGPPITAMLIQNTNPAAVCPDSNLVRQGFMRDDLFTVVHEQFMTDTAIMADIILPACTFLEYDDLYVAGGHTYMQLARKLVEPYADSRANHWVIAQLAHRLNARHPGFDMTELEIIDQTLKRSGYAGLEIFDDKPWHDCALPFKTMHFLDGFAHPDGKFHFRPHWASIGPHHQGLPEWPDHCDVYEAADAEHPFRLVTAPARQFLNSTFTETPTSQSREKRPTVKIHPNDCRALGLVDGDRVRIGNRRGNILIHAMEFAGLQPGVCIVESVWPNNAFIEGIGINALTSADHGRPKGGAVFHDSAVWIVKA